MSQSLLEEPTHPLPSAIFVNGASNVNEEAAIRGRAESAPAPSAVLSSGAPAWAVPRCLQRCVPAAGGGLSA